MKQKFVSILLFILFALIFQNCSSKNNSELIFKNKNISVLFDQNLHSRIVAEFNEDILLTAFSPSEYIVINQKPIKDFSYETNSKIEVHDSLGKGEEFVITGTSKENIKKNIIVSKYKNFPATLFYKVIYTNVDSVDVKISKWVNNSYQLLPSEDGFWSYQGASFEDRRDWVFPLTDGFEQENYMGMNASDYGGGTPITDVWSKDAGIAIGHLEPNPKLVKMPVSMKKKSSGVSIGLEFENEIILKPGEKLQTFETFVNVHQGDYYSTLKMFKEVLAHKGLVAPIYPETAYEPIWCTWGYERDFNVDEVLATLPKVKELGFKWVVLDDGWQTAEGDWYLDHKKFPMGDIDMISFVNKIKEYGLKPKLWWAPLAVDPGTDLIKNYSDMLLLNEDGSTRDITWWDSYYLCPAYDKTLKYTKDFVVKVMEKWGFEGLKIDGHHLNGVPPCYNEKHKHASPEESVEKLQAFWKLVYETAEKINKDAVVELCPCGTCYSFYNMPYMNQPVSSDPLSSWQIRLKGKTLKGLMGDNAPYYGDHVELSDNGDDWATSVGIGGVIGTKFIWPAGLHNEKLSGADLTPEREIKCAKWMGIYNDKMLPKGTYLGELYDIGFDVPETHAIKKDSKMYYAFYDKEWNGTVELRGLENKKYRIIDYVNNIDLGELNGESAKIDIKFNQFLLIESTPIN